MAKRIIAALLATIMIFSCLTGCRTETTDSSVPGSDGTSSSESATETTQGDVKTPKWPAGTSAEDICAQLTLEQKASQMVLGAYYKVKNSEMEENCWGALLSTTQMWPGDDVDTWIKRIRKYQQNALNSEAGVPYIYGQDTVHGVYSVAGGIVYPHNINIGAANNAELTYEYGKLAASDMKHVGTIWTYSPCVALAQDPRWGRTYESLSSNLDRLTPLALQFTKGMLDEGVIVCAKHFLGDGNTLYGTGESSNGTARLIDRGNAVMTDAQIAEQMELYHKLIEAGAQTIMITHSALNGVKMHENGEYIMKLKNDYNFKGFIVSDWDSIHNCSGDTLYDNVVLAINAGIDMLMEEKDYEDCRDYIVEAVGKGDISEERVNDAVTRIIRVKIEAGIFEDPFLENTNPSYDWASDHGKEVARQLAAESLVPIKAGKNLTIPKGARVFVTGPASIDTGALCGGWTINWNGSSDTENGNTWLPYAKTIVDALKDIAGECGFEIETDPDEIDTCDMVLLCLGENSYAEWNGDTPDLSITGSCALSGNEEAIKFAADSGLPTTTLIIAGRNVIINEYVDQWDSVIMCYLPGSEGGKAIADVVSGKVPFKGTLPMPYYSSVEQIGTGECWLDVGYSAVN